MLAAIQLKRKTLPMYGRFAHAKSAWYETCQQQKCLLLASCVLLPLYNNMLLLSCMVAGDHLRFHVVGMRMPLHVYLVGFLHLCFYQSAAAFHERHVTLNPLRMTHLPKREGYTLGHYSGSSIYSRWILVCVVASALNHIEW
eukprot:4966132-Amphidinium_carterae.1